jgi:nucleoid-associated protein YgaU
MPGHSTIVLPLLLVGCLGAAVGAYTAFGPHGRQVSDEAAVDGTANPPAQDQAKGTDQAAAMTGSAARRMDDFGAGPSGTTVTVPLKGRHRQAFGAQDKGGGGSAPDEKKSSSYRLVERTPGADDVAAGNPSAGQPATDDVTAPTFDIVRVDPAGNAVLAGRSAPLAEVEIKAGDEVVDRVTATATGEWVSTPTTPLAAGDQELSLSAVDEGTKKPVLSRHVVVVSIPEQTEQAEEAPDEAVAVILDKAKGGEGRILQAPDKLEGDGDGELTLKLVDYDDQGAIKLSGEAPPGVPVRIYVDNEPAALVIGDSEGYWITTLDQDLPGGDYTLRLDQLDKDGQTVARLETPLTRVTTPPVEGEAKVDYVVVQPGNSLWRIARRLSGDGFNYVYIFEANQAQIRDPDVIYPGQVFEVPNDVEVAG